MNKPASELIALADLRSANTTRQAEWDPDNQLTLAYRGNELAGEVGEACNVIKKLEREQMGIPGSRDTIAHLAEELADVVICADLIASSVGIDLDQAVRDKFNATSEKHGFKTRLAANQSGSERAGVDALREALDCLQSIADMEDDEPRQKHQHPDKWDQMEIRGEQGSIRIAAADLKQLLPFVTHCTAPDKLYDLNEEGRAALSKAEGHIGQEPAPGESAQ